MIKTLTINKFSDKLDILIEDLEKIRKAKIEAQNKLYPSDKTYQKLSMLIEEIDRVLLPLKSCGDRIANWEKKEAFMGLKFFD